MSASDFPTETIVAVATPPGIGGVSVIRVSGPLVTKLSLALTGNKLVARHATLSAALDATGEVLDKGLALYFPNPHSFTGEDVLEFQGHGGLLVTDSVMRRIVELGARLAEPGEFSKRAYLNGKIDLIQAEATADLINAVSLQAARSAQRSLEGEFSRAINELTNKLIALRTEVEAAIDFPEEDIELQNQQLILDQVRALKTELGLLQSKAQKGSQIREGSRLVLVGPPNVGKSSLLNRLTGSDAAIVTDIPGTTRDLIRQNLLVRGVLVEMVDTAGLRGGAVDLVEEEGIRRTRRELGRADHLVMVTDVHRGLGAEEKTLLESLPADREITLLVNKVDLANGAVDQVIDNPPTHVCYVSAKTGEGIEAFERRIEDVALRAENEEGVFSARRRHLSALAKAATHLTLGIEEYLHSFAGELLAEELLLAQNALGEITGKVTSDELLGEIFSSFCIGK